MLSPLRGYDHSKQLQQPQTEVVHFQIEGLDSVQKLAQDARELSRLFPGGIVSCFGDYSHLAACDVLVH
jgi:hypothetical protein